MKEQLPNIKLIIKEQSRKCCSVQSVKNRLPILTWLPAYKFQFLIQDFVAGLTVGLTAIPQSIAYAGISGLPTQYGLYSAFMGCFVYIIFGSCKDITIGPTAIMSLMIQQHVGDNPDFAVLACFLSGCIVFLFGILNLGVLVQFISTPVVTGFTTAAAITIGSGQINSLFGITSSSNEFLSSWETFFTKITTIRLYDSILGVTTLLCLILLRSIKDVSFLPKSLSKYLALSRNALAVIVGILLSYLLTSEDGTGPFIKTGEIVPGLPKFQIPPFHSSTPTQEYDFMEMISELGTSLITIPLVSIIEVVAIAKAFSKGKPVDASQEMFAMGLCNIVGSFVQSMPITGSFTRSAINNSSGVRTVLGGAVTGTLVLLTLAFLTQTFHFIPKASLAAIIISAMIFMVEYERIAEIWKSKKIDTIPLIVTILTCLFLGLEYGMLLGVAVNILFLLYASARPTINIHNDSILGVNVTIVQPHDNIVFSSAEYTKEKILNYATNQPDVKFVVLDGSEIFSIDSTVAFNLLMLIEDLKAIDCEIIFWNWNLKTTGVICRLNSEIKYIFKNSKTIEESMLEILKDNNNKVDF